jgi:hypothetical protein
LRISVQNLYLLGYYSPEQYDSEIAKIENMEKMVLMSLDEEIIMHHLCPVPGSVTVS